MAVTDDNVAFLGDLLDTSSRQLGPRGEILLVNLGTLPMTARAVERASAADGRVRSCALPGRSVADAFNEGARLARQELVAFCEAGDLLAEGALPDLAADLKRRAGGAQVAGGDRSMLGRVRLEDLLVRRSLWTRTGARVAEGPFASWAVAARLILAGDATASSQRMRSGARRGTGVAFGTLPVLAPWISSWRAAALETLERVDGDVRSAFLRWLLEDELVGYLADSERCTDEQWSTLSATTVDLVGAVPAQVVADLGVETRARVLLATGGHRAELDRFNADRWNNEGQFPTRVVGGRVVADLSVGAALPERTLDLATSESPLTTVLKGLHWTSDGALELVVFSFVQRAGTDSGTIPITAWLVDDGDGRQALEVQRGHPDPEANVVAGDRFNDHSGSVFHLRLDAQAVADMLRRGARWHLKVRFEAAGLVREGGLDDVDQMGAAGALPPHPSSELTVRPRKGDRGAWRLDVQVPDPGSSRGADWLVDELVLDPERAEILVRGVLGAGDPPTGLELRSPRASTFGTLTTGPSGFEARLQLTHRPFGLSATPLPPAAYRLYPRRDGRSDAALAMSPALASTTPSTQRTRNFRMRLQRGRDGAAVVRLAAPLRDDEVGPFAQHQLQRWYASDEHRVDPSTVFLQAYTGQSATDSPLAVHQALRRLRPDLRTFWSVADRSTALPQGAEPVVLRSREWYERLATCGSVVTNIDLDRWYRRRPGQRVLQTFHGYPSKTMGISAWEAKNLTRLRIERQLRRTSGTWDLLLTPTREMDEHYRREYRYDGEILAEGYPRDDVLVGPERSSLREQTRRRLAIGDEQRVILYAPTWRDDLATNFRSAAMSTAFDLEAAAADLGGDYVLLMRGHRFHRQRPSRATARILDVTDHPEINDLILASDAAVLDYSSLRFDFALTGRPMVFLVPDLGRYTGNVRGFLFDFESSAPGPLVATTEEVVSALRDLDHLTREFRDEMARFNARFNDRQDGHAAERVVRAFFGPSPDATVAPGAVTGL